jgi:molybdenum-dependent DNA-binding transcriptional regulator ModE
MVDKINDKVIDYLCNKDLISSIDLFEKILTQEDYRIMVAYVITGSIRSAGKLIGISERVMHRILSKNSKMKEEIIKRRAEFVNLYAKDNK